MTTTGMFHAASGRVAVLREVMELKRPHLVAKHAFVLSAVVVICLVRGDAVLLAWILPYFLLDISQAPHMDRLLRRNVSPDRLAQRITIHNAVVTASFAGFAAAVSFEGTYPMQLAALMLLTGHSFYALGVHAPARELLWSDVVAVIAASQLVAFFSDGWATGIEQVLLHLGLAMLGLFFVHSARQAHAIHHNLRLTTQRLVNAQRAGVVGRLTGGIAHDFNNLLTVMKGNLDLLHEVPAEERPALLAQIEEAAMRGGELVSRLAETGRPDAAHPTLANLAEVANRAIGMAGRTLPANVRMSVGLAQGADVVRADPSQLELGLLNLLINARDALPRGGTVRLSSSVQNNGTVRLTVEDDGIGMSPDLLARATEPYETTKPPGEGSGLGLAMVQAFAESSGGRLEIDSAPARGTRVHLWLRGAGAVAGTGSAA